MARLDLPVHAASFAIPMTSSPAAKKVDRQLLSFLRSIAADDFTSLNSQSVVQRLRLALCASSLSNALAPVTAVLAELEQHQPCTLLDATQTCRDVLAL